MHEHTGTLNRFSFTIANDGASGFEARPKAMNDISFCLLRVLSKIRITSLWTFAYFIPRDGSRSLDLQRHLQIDAEIGADDVRFGKVSASTGLVGYRKLVGLAGSFIEPRRRGSEVVDIDRLPCLLSCLRVCYLAGELDGWKPNSA
jgi:hypothetical protein